jgi:uncharacterized membrane protein YphA (DoxX/SURF4 family)
MQKFQAIGIRFVAAYLTLRTGAFRKAQRNWRKGHLQRLFSAFPGGWPGVGLLLLRAAVGLVALIEGAFYLTQNTGSAPGTWLGGLLGLAAGGALLAGFLTPAAGVIVGLGALGVGFSVLPEPTPNLFDARLSAILAAIMAAAIVFLGPGAFSLDARLFGRREIIIPQAPRRPES